MDKTVHRPSRQPEKRNAITCGCQRRRRVGGRKDIKQEEGLREGQILGTMEGVHSKRRHLGELGKPAECRRFIKGIQRGIQERQ